MTSTFKRRQIFMALARWVRFNYGDEDLVQVHQLVRMLLSCGNLFCAVLIWFFGV